MDQKPPLTPDRVGAAFPPDDDDLFSSKVPPFPEQEMPGAHINWMAWQSSINQVALLLEQERYVPEQEITEACDKLLKHSTQLLKYLEWLPPEQRVIFQDGANTADVWLRSHGIQPMNPQQRPTGRRRR